jgi:hypothetical protein
VIRPVPSDGSDAGDYLGDRRSGCMGQLELAQGAALGGTAGPGVTQVLVFVG